MMICKFKEAGAFFMGLLVLGLIAYGLFMAVMAMPLFIQIYVLAIFVAMFTYITCRNAKIF